MRTTIRAATLLALCLLLFVSADAQAQGRGGPGGRGNGGDDKSSGDSKSSIKPYDEVITKEATTQPGLFLIHELDDKLFYEIPTDKLGKDMLWVASLERTQAGFSYAGMPIGDRVVRWELRDETILLRDVKYTIRAEVDDPIQQAVEATSVAPIIETFPVKAWGPDQRPVIDVTSLFTSDVSEFSAKNILNGQSLDSKKTFIEEVKNFPENINTEVMVTFKLANGAGRDSSQSAVTAVVHHSMRQLPENPMQPREFDPRVGFFTVGFDDFGQDEYHEVESVRYITRWRLEKKDPEAEVSEPVKPIVFYVGREVPEKWKPYVKKGIEMWQPAFEEAGFKNAILGKLAPEPTEDPDWDPEDSRVSTIRWLPSSIENAFGPHVHDPRTGEILEADVRIYHNVLKLARDWYFVQASPNDERAQKLPLPDDLVGELLAYIVAHEVGHSIGFPHNMKASAAYSVANLRDPEFTKKYGTEASIMDYGRFNYVAQPGDGAALIPVIGPYDFFAVKWGYRQYANAEEEEKGLNELFAMQKDNPLLRFGNADPSQDPTRQTEDLSGDSLEATRLGMKNIDRVASYLVTACCSEGQDYDLLQNMYDQLISQRTRELNHVTAIVGGFEEINLFYGDADQIYHPIPAAKQKEAVAFLLESCFQTNAKLIDPAITLRLESSGAPDRILGSQRSVLRSLLSDSRIDRMSEQVARTASQADAAPVYSPLELMTDLRTGIWSELEADQVNIDLYRRNLQRLYVETLGSKVNNDSASSDLPALAREELQTLESLIEGKLDASSGVTRAHLEHVLAMIERIFDPVPAAAPTAATAPGPRRRPGSSPDFE